MSVYQIGQEYDAKFRKKMKPATSSTLHKLSKCKLVTVCVISLTPIIVRMEEFVMLMNKNLAVIVRMTILESDANTVHVINKTLKNNKQSMFVSCSLF